MDLSKRLVQVKSSAKEKGYPTFTPEDIIFVFGDVTHREGLMLNHSNPSKCFVLFSLTAPIADIYSLNESPSWVGTSMQLSIRQPCSSIISIISRLLEDKALEEGEEYEVFPIRPLNQRMMEVHSHTLLPKRRLSL